jgi:hypothetical protein
VAISYNRGQTFRFVGNLPLAQYYHVAVDNETPYNIYGGMQDNGSWRGPSNVWRRGGIRNYDWIEVGGGDGFETLPHPTDATVGYSPWQGGNIMRWNLRTGEQKLLKPADPKDLKLRFNWNAGLATDPFEPDAVYLGSQFVHQSTDRGESWTTISPDLTTNNPEWQKADRSGGLTPAEDAPPPTEDPTGPEVPPGIYTVTMTYGTHVSKQTVKVAPDPRSSPRGLQRVARLGGHRLPETGGGGGGGGGHDADQHQDALSRPPHFSPTAGRGPRRFRAVRPRTPVPCFSALSWRNGDCPHF